MSSGNKVYPLAEENSLGSSDIKNNLDKNNIIIGLKKKKSEEDDKSMNSAEYSAQILQMKENQKLKLSNSTKTKFYSNKEYAKYIEKLKERTMRFEVEKIYNETERLKNKYEEKMSHLHSFDNNPQFQKMLKMVGNQLRYFFIGGIFLIIFSSLLFFYITKRKEGLALTSFCLSIFEIVISVILFISLKLGLLNDPNLSKAFRLFVVIESLLLFTSFIINIIAGLLNNEYFKEIKEYENRLIIYIIFLIMIIMFIIVLKYCFNLFFESVLILLGRKTEYSILMINEENNKYEINFNVNLSTNSNNITTEGLNNESTGIFKVDNNINNNIEKKEEEKFRTFNYFNKFHYSVTSSRNQDYGGFKKG